MFYQLGRSTSSSQATLTTYIISAWISSLAITTSESEATVKKIAFPGWERKEEEEVHPHTRPSHVGPTVKQQIIQDRRMLIGMTSI